MRPGLVFKSAVSIFLVAEIGLLWGIVFLAFQEYSLTHELKFGFAIAILCVMVGSAALLWSFYQLLKWKSD